MPIYEYECNACGDRHEFIQKFSEGPKRKCPSCGEQRLRKLISAAAFHLKGSGWYVTDFRDRDKKKANGKAEKEQTKAEASSETKAETKPAKKEPKKKSSGATDTA
jgi:putative FmdB family regulatory protein